MSERETGAQSEQVTCHKRNDDEVRGPHWECKLPGVKGGWVLDPPFCPTCGTGLRADGTEQARCDVVTSEAVKGTEFWCHLEAAMGEPQPEFAFVRVLAPEMPIIYAALQQGGLAAAEWLAAEIARLSGRFVNSEAASMTLEDELALRATAAPTLTPGYWLAAALTATGAAQGEGDTALLDTVSAECIAKAAFFSMLALEGVKGGFAEYKRQSVTPAGDAGEPEFAKILANAIVIMASTILAYRQAHGHSKTQQEFSECIAGFLTEARAAIIAQGKGGGDGV